MSHRKPYRPPKGIVSHPAVESCEFAPDLGFDDIGPRGYVDIRAVELKDGWRFSGVHLHDGIRQSVRFRTVANFRSCKPVRFEHQAD